jgi:hypothetical protein
VVALFDDAKKKRNQASQNVSTSRHEWGANYKLQEDYIRDFFTFNFSKNIRIIN